MSWTLFGQIVMLIVIYALISNFVKCMHNAYCIKCKKP